MALQFDVNPPEFMPETVALLREAFQAPSDSPNFQDGLLHWKFYESGPAWTGPRSYALRKANAMVAHGCVWPIHLASSAGPVPALIALDWVGAKAVPGAGIMIMRKFEGMAPVVISIGGSEDTCKVLPQIGFAKYAVHGLYARVLRPWRQFRTRPREGIKGFARLARNTAWSLAGLCDSNGWSSQAAEHPDAQFLARWNAHPATITESRYEAQFLEFLLRCPAVRFEYFSLLKSGRSRGFFMLARSGGQTRLADLRILSNQPEDWTAAYAVATRAAATDREACELVACAPSPAIASALEANGFRRRGEVPIFVRDPKRLLPDSGILHLSMFDNDSAFLVAPEYPYTT